MNRFVQCFATLLAYAGLAIADATPLALRTEYQNTAPKFIRSAAGEFSGLCVELLALIGRQARIEFSQPGHFVPRKRIQANLEQGQTDVYCGIKQTANRLSKVLFSDPLYSVAYIVLGRRDETNRVASIKQLGEMAAEQPVLSIFGSGNAADLKRRLRFLDDTAHDLRTNLRKLLAGRGRFLIYYDLALRYELDHPDNHDLRNTTRIVGQDIEPYNHYLAFSRKLAPELIEHINLTIQALRNGDEWQSILTRYRASPALL